MHSVAAGLYLNPCCPNGPGSRAPSEAVTSLDRVLADDDAHAPYLAELQNKHEGVP